MLDRYLLSYKSRLLFPLAKLAVGVGFSATSITLTGFFLVFPLFFLIVKGHFLWGLFFLFLNRLLDGLDGEVARLTKQDSNRGAFLDIVLDYYFYLAVPLAFAFYDPSKNALFSSLLLASFLTTAVPFLAYANFLAREGLTEARSEKMEKKGFYFLEGLAEGTETIAFFVVFMLFPENYPFLSIVFALICFVTGLYRSFIIFFRSKL